ncbi:carbon-nitrogen hydrolase [Biscogniauxia mediterranea]|nr:carbon-nitrogen hydrolase [Biscogniauxia mediterranea]
MNCSVRVAICHAAPVFLSARKTTEKAISLITEAAKNKASLVAFPESYIPAFPIWSALRAPTENHDLFKRMALESIYSDGEEMKAIQAAAKKRGVMTSIGFSEKVRYSSATLFNSNVIIDTQGKIIVHHRKLMPTFFEKLTWSPGDGYGLRVADTEFGKIGNLICGENTNPLARYALMAQGEQVHISTWPAVWPTRNVKKKNPPTLGQENEQGLSSMGRGANYDNVAANKIRASAHCFEAKCFGVVSSGFLDADAISTVVDGSMNPESVQATLEKSPRGASMFLDPAGMAMPGFMVNSDASREWRDFLQTEEGILYADLDLNDCIEGKQYHDVVGGYQRLDVFNLKIDNTRKPPAEVR